MADIKPQISILCAARVDDDVAQHLPGPFFLEALMFMLLISTVGAGVIDDCRAAVGPGDGMHAHPLRSGITG